jgi:hypothetical protein
MLPKQQFTLTKSLKQVHESRLNCNFTKKHIKALL